MHATAAQIRGLATILVLLGSALGLVVGLIMGNVGLWASIGTAAGLVVSIRLALTMRGSREEWPASAPGQVDGPLYSREEEVEIRRKYRWRRLAQKLAIGLILVMGLLHATFHEYLDTLPYFRYPVLVYLVVAALVSSVFHRSFRCPGCEQFLAGIDNPMVCGRCRVRLRD
jgi:H+/Cl- antiporter ClcA